MANRETYLGEFEHIVLLALIRLKDDAYGMTIRMEIDERIGRSVSIGAVYTTLERLETKRKRCYSNFTTVTRRCKFA